jgi:hypothetical protein
MKTTSDWNFGPYLGRIGFAPRDSHIGIQVADILARETMKHCDNFFIGSPTRRIRASMELLISTQKHKFMYWHKDHFEDWKRKMPLLEKVTGLRRGDYSKWLEKNNLPDTSTNRNKYLLETRGKK